MQSCRVYINKLSDSEAVRKELENLHNGIFKEIEDSKLFRKFNGLNFLPNADASGRYMKAKTFINSLNEKYGVTVVATTFTKPTGREYVFVNVKNLVDQVEKGLFPEQGELFQEETMPSSIASPVTLDKFRVLAQRAGLQGNYLTKMEVNGKLYDANGVAQLAQGLYYVVKGKETTAEPEEIMHFAVEAIEQSDPTLFRQLLGGVGNYVLYNETFKKYSSKYTTPEGKPDVVKIKKEAIAKIITEYAIKQEENSIEKPENMQRARNWWTKIKEWFLSLLGKAGFNPFEKAANKFLAGELTGPGAEKNWSTIILENTPEGNMYKIGFENYIVEKNYRMVLQEVYSQLADENSYWNGVDRFFAGDNELTDKFISYYNDVYLQGTDSTTKRDKLYNDIKTNKGTPITKKLITENGEEKEVYEVAGKIVKRRVTDIVKSFYQSIFGDRNITESQMQRAIDDLRKEYGTAGHQDMEHAFHALVDSDGYIKANPDTSPYSPSTNDIIYATLFKNLQERLATYPTGTRFLPEVKIYDPKRDIAGTIDFLAIDKDGGIHILDWKFVDIQTDSFKDVPWYSKKAYRKQIGQYKRILEDAYGTRPVDFKQGEAIPIKTNYKYVKATDGKLYPLLVSISIGNVDTKVESRDYLLPVPLEGQSTGDKKLDTLIRKVRGLGEKIGERPSRSIEERFAKAEQLQAIETAVRHLQIKKALEPLLEQAGVFNKDVEILIALFNNNLKNKDFKDIPQEELNEFGGRLSELQTDLSVYTDLDNETKHLFTGELTEEQQATKDKLHEVVSNARGMLGEIKDIISQYGEKLGEARGVFNVNDAEVVVNWNRRLFNETSKIPTKTVQLLYSLRREAQNKMDISTAKETTELQEIEKAYDKLAKANGWGKKDRFSILKKKGANELIDQYKKDFYSQLRAATKTKDIKWIKENINVEAYKTKLAENLQRQIELIETRPWTEDRINDEIARKKRQFDISTDLGLGWFAHYKTMWGFPLAEKWTSDEWKELNRSENKAALDLYNWVRTINQKAEGIGYLPDRKTSRTFLPFVPQSLVEAAQTGGKINAWERIIRSITVDEDTIGYGSYDKITGQLINKIPRYLTNETTKDLSIDLISNVATYNEFVNRYKYLSEIEGTVLALGKLERNKASIVTSSFGKPSFNKDTQTFDQVETNEKNADLYDRQVATLIYGQKYVNIDKFDQVLGNAGEIGKKINKALHIKLLPENFTDRQLSMSKGVDTLNSFFQLKTLGLSVLPAASNYLGGNLQITINAGQYFTKKDAISAEFGLLSMPGGTEQGKKLKGALDMFVPFTRDVNQDKIRGMSINGLSPNSIQDFLMILMRGGDRVIESTIFSSLLNNAVVIDGELHNAREYIRSSETYRNRYSSAEELRAQEGSFEKQVDDLIEQHGFWKSTKVEGDKLVVEGLNNLENTIFEVRNLTKALSKRVVGNMSPEEVRGISQNMVGASFMIFKNWIPSLWQVRFGAMKFDSDIQEYEWGRARTIARMVALNGFSALNKLRGAFKGTEKGIESLNELYEYKKQAHFESTGQQLELTKEEFFDLTRQNIRSAAKDALITLTLIAMWLTAKLAIPDDEEDPQVMARYRYMLRALDKFSDEVMFYYSPLTFQKMLSGTLFPSIGSLQDFTNTFWHFMKEIWGVTFDEDLEEQNYTIKYFLRSFPITSQLSTYLPLFLPELAKELGIKTTAKSRLF